MWHTESLSRPHASHSRGCRASLTHIHSPYPLTHSTHSPLRVRGAGGGGAEAPDEPGGARTRVRSAWTRRPWGPSPPRGGASQRTLVGHWEFSKLRGSSGRWTQAGWGGSRAVGSHVVPGPQAELWSLTPRVAGGGLGQVRLSLKLCPRRAEASRYPPPRPRKGPRPFVPVPRTDARGAAPRPPGRESPCLVLLGVPRETCIFQVRGAEFVSAVNAVTREAEPSPYETRPSRLLHLSRASYVPEAAWPHCTLLTTL